MSDTNLIIIFMFSAIVAFFIIIFLIYKSKSKSLINEKKLNTFHTNISEIQGSLIILTKTIEDKISNINKNIGSSLNEQTEKTQKSLSEMRERLAIIDNAHSSTLLKKYTFK